MIKEIDVEEMEDLVRQGALLVDVREEDEIAAGMIEGSVHMPLSDFASYKAKLSKEKPVIFYCRSGRRSLKSAEMAESWGCQEIYSLAGGYLAYVEED